MSAPLQERNLLLLENDNVIINMANEVLESPLKLAKSIIYYIFEGKLLDFKEDLDIIKGFAAGIERAAELKSYPVADYHLAMFSFQQWFHSSYRARQGKVLENILRKTLSSYTKFRNISQSSRDTQLIISHKLLQADEKIQIGDIDICGVSEENKRILIIQLRSRDDTGGTTAKTSLIESLRDILRLHRQTSQNYELLYLVGVWDERDTRQRSTTITKFYQALKDYIQLDSKDFEDIGRGISIAPGIRLRLAYGVRGIIEAICDWDKSQDRTQEVLTAVEKIIYKLRNWDDLWLAYAIASMEIHVQIIHGHSNALLLVNKLRDMEVDITASQETLPSLLEDTLRKLTQKWREDTLPVRCLADQILYLRDLLLLFAIYTRHCNKQESK